MKDKEKFQLNSDVQKKIDNEYYYPYKNTPKKVKVKPKPKPVPKPAPKPPVRAAAPEPKAAEVFADSREFEEFDPEEEAKRKRRRKKLHKLMAGIIVFCLLLTLFDVAFFFYRGQIWFNEPRKRDYPVRGAVVDQDLGEINWEIMSRQTISFAYIRATRGKTGVDKQFEDNRVGIIHTDLLSGFYHEFVFGSDGEKQAENFIKQCGDMSGRLRPMVKVEKYGIYNFFMKNADDTAEELQKFLDRVEEEYGRRCIIMCDSACYKKYIRDDFSKYTLWTVNHFSKPDEDLDWALWEFNPRVRTEGYSNSKKYFSLTVYRREKDIENFKKNLLMD